MRSRRAIERRNSTCPTCSLQFEQELGKGKGRKHCSPGCREKYKHAQASARAKVARKLAPHRVISGRYATSAGYIKVLAKGHPLADKIGHVYEHRKVLFDSGESASACFWCSKKLDWQSAVVDHLNENKADNRLENLVVACVACNRARGAFLDMMVRVDSSKVDALFDMFRQFKRRANA